MSGSTRLPEDQKIISMMELKSQGLSHYQVNKLVSEGKLIKLNKSHYENAGYRGEESVFYYVDAYAPKGCHLPAQRRDILSTDDIHSRCRRCCHTKESKGVHHTRLASNACLLLCR